MYAVKEMKALQPPALRFEMEPRETKQSDDDWLRFGNDRTTLKMI